MINDAQLKSIEAEHHAHEDAENEWIVRNARRYLALRENEIAILAAVVKGFDADTYRAEYDAVADRLLEGGE